MGEIRKSVDNVILTLADRITTKLTNYNAEMGLTNATFLEIEALGKLVAARASMKD